MVVALLDLWLPIVLSAVVVFIASALAWMALPHHKKDFGAVPNEDALMSTVRSQNLAPGMYAFPDCQDQSKMKDPAFKAKLDAGSTGMLHVWPPGTYTKMGGKMAGSFVFYLVTSVFVAYLASRANLLPGASFSDVFQITGTAAIMAYCFARIPNDIWFNTPQRAMMMNLIDGVVYGLLTGVIFAWMWPGL